MDGLIDVCRALIKDEAKRRELFMARREWFLLKPMVRAVRMVLPVLAYG